MRKRHNDGKIKWFKFSEKINCQSVRFFRAKITETTDQVLHNSTKGKFISCGGEKMKVYLASDLHLGHENANYPKITEFLNLVQKDGDKLIILGDLLDLWVSDFITITTQEPMKSTWEKLIETSKKVTTVVVYGNHDFELSKYTHELMIVDEFEQDNMYFAHGWRWDIEQQIGLPFFDDITAHFHIIYQKFIKTPFQIINSPDQFNDYINLLTQIATLFAETHH
jgi:predicted MPP superfamily phosphohydrolase